MAFARFTSTAAILAQVPRIFMLLGTFSVNNRLLDPAVLIVMGVLGYGLRKLKFDVAPMILAVVRGPLMEKIFRQSLFMSSGSLAIFVERPVCVALFVATLLAVLSPLAQRLFHRPAGAGPGGLTGADRYGLADLSPNLYAVAS